MRVARTGSPAIIGPDLTKRACAPEPPVRDLFLTTQTSCQMLSDSKDSRKHPNECILFLFFFLSFFFLSVVVVVLLLLDVCMFYVDVATRRDFSHVRFSIRRT